MTVPDALAQQLRNILDAGAATTALEEQRIAAVEAQGFRIVDGGQLGSYDADGKCDFKFTDWRPGRQCLPATAPARNSTRPWTPRPPVTDATGATWTRPTRWPPTGADNYGIIEPDPVPGVPESLISALQDWAESGATSDQDLAGVTGLPVARVGELRRATGR